MRPLARCAYALRRRQALIKREDDENDVPIDSGFLTAHDAAALLNAAPQMTLLAPVRCMAADAPRLLNKEAPFERLRMSRLSLVDSVRSSSAGRNGAVVLTPEAVTLTAVKFTSDFD